MLSRRLLTAQQCFFWVKIWETFPNFGGSKNYWVNFEEKIYPILPTFGRKFDKFQRENIITMLKMLKFSACGGQWFQTIKSKLSDVVFLTNLEAKITGKNRAEGAKKLGKF